MRSIMRKVFDCTLGALWRLYVKMLVYEIVDVDHDLSFSDWAAAIAVTLSFICAILAALMLLLLLLLVAIVIDFPLPVICSIIGIAVICILPWLALKSYRSSKAKAARASSRKAVKTARASKKEFNQ